MAQQHHILAGLDENGVGPMLGPMVVTIVLARANAAGTRSIRNKREKLGGRLDDSKAIASYHDGALAEAWTRALAARLSLPCDSPGTLLDALRFEANEAMEARCSPGHRQCSETDEPFVAAPEMVDLARRDLNKLAARGIDVIGVKSAILCTRVLNNAAAEGVSRFRLDLNTMEDLLLWGRATAGENLNAVCGKVGGYMYYEREFGPLGDRLRTVLQETKVRSAYRFPDLGEVAFVRDADASDGLVALASIVGKWVRDRMMTRVVNHHQHFAADAPNCSGYHDPVTQQFVKKTALTRKRRKFPDDCFARRKATVV
jgi:ribonuclease HII